MVLSKFFNPNNQNGQSWLSNLLGCMCPLYNSIRFNRAFASSTDESNWEVPYHQISDKEFIASGSQGTVFKAKFRNRTIALKKVLNIKETSATYKLKDLDHVNIIKFFGISSTPPCVLMEFCPNGSLADLLIDQKYHIQPLTTWDYLVQIGKCFGKKKLNFIQFDY